MERRLSIVLAAAGLLGAFGMLVLGRGTPSSDVLHAVAVDLDALIRESAAGVKERADTLAQLPRVSWAVATDEATVRDLTNEELAFRTHPGEHIEITQMRKGGGEPRRLLRRPADSDLNLPLIVGTHVVVRDNRLQLVTVVSIEPHERADLMVGILAVAKQLDTSALEQRLAARRISAEVRTIQGSFVLAGSAPAPSAVEARIALTGPAAEGAEVVAVNLGAARWPRVVAPLVLVLSLAGAALLWRRGAGSPRLTPLEVPFAGGFDETTSEPAARPTATVAAPPAVPPPASPPARPPLLARSTTPAPGTRPAKATPVEAYPTRLPTPGFGSKARPIRPTTPALGAPKVTPVTGVAAVPEEAVPVPIESLGRSGRVDTSLIRTGSVSLSARPAGAPASPAAPKPDPDPRAEQYRTLFAEFVKLRKTTGESVDDLDANQFVETLRAKRAQILKQIPVKDVQFKLAFHNGKAAIRYSTVT